MQDDLLALPAHAATLFRGLRLDAYGLDLEAGAGTRGFDAILADWRGRLRRGPGGDAFGPEHGAPVEPEALDDTLAGALPQAAGLLQGALEEHAAALAALVRRVLLMPEWHGTQRILVGGGLRATRLGEVAVGRAAVMLRTEGSGVRLAPLRHDAEEAGLVGAARLVPLPMLRAFDGVLTADLGGGAFRAGIVLPRLGVAPELAAAGVWRRRRWRHAGEKADRAAAIGRLAGMLGDLAGEAAAAGISLAPVIAVGVPAVVEPDGRLARGAEALPGDWLSGEFRLAAAVSRLVALPGTGHPPVLLHNDTVAQGLSEAPFLRDVARWGVLAPGGGLGNARFSNLPMRR